MLCSDERSVNISIAKGSVCGHIFEVPRIKTNQNEPFASHSHCSDLSVFMQIVSIFQTVSISTVHSTKQSDPYHFTPEVNLGTTTISQRSKDSISCIRR